jgi:hypothetical protein
MGPLAQLYAYLQARRFDETPPRRPHQGLLEDRPMPPGLGPRPFRDPMQEGPEPPVSPMTLAQIYGARRE